MGTINEGIATAQIIMMALTGGLIVIALGILLKKGKEDKGAGKERGPEIVRAEEQGREALNAKKIYRMARELEEIQEELIQLKKEQKQMNHRMASYFKKAETEKKEPFDQVLNYSLFAQKNEEVLARFEKGMDPKEIARELDKSVREVDMVIKLAKQKK